MGRKKKSEFPGHFFHSRPSWLRGKTLQLKWFFFFFMLQDLKEEPSPCTARLGCCYKTWGQVLYIRGKNLFLCCESPGFPGLSQVRQAASLQPRNQIERLGSFVQGICVWGKDLSWMATRWRLSPPQVNILTCFVLLSAESWLFTGRTVHAREDGGTKEAISGILFVQPD